MKKYISKEFELSIIVLKVCNELITNDDRIMSVAIMPGASSEAIHSHAECYEYVRSFEKSQPSQDWRIIYET